MRDDSMSELVVNIAMVLVFISGLIAGVTIFYPNNNKDLCQDYQTKTDIETIWLKGERECWDIENKKVIEL